MRDLILGPDELVTSEPAKKVDGVWVGASQFERNDDLVGVKGTRCYTVTPSRQVQRSLVSPTASGKIPDATRELPEHLVIRQRLIKVTRRYFLLLFLFYVLTN